jgi:hypothetical protein
MLTPFPSEEALSFWTIRPSNLQEPLSLDLGRRRKAALCFTSKERACDFQKADFMERKWKVVEMRADACAAWLRQRMKHGTQVVFRNPSNLFCLGKPISVQELLAEIETSTASTVIEAI